MNETYIYIHVDTYNLNELMVQLDEWVLCRIRHKGSVAEAAKEEGGSSSNACSFEGDEKSDTTSVKDALESIKRVLSLDEHEWASSNSSI